VVLAILFAWYLLYDLYTQLCITTELQRAWYMCFWDFFSEDWWNFVNVASVVLNFFVIKTLVEFMLIGGELVRVSLWPFDSWTQEYQFDQEVDINTVDQMGTFERAGSLYSSFLGLSAVNGLFVTVRLIKYFNALPQLRLVMDTLASAFNELMIMMVIIFMMLIGFVAMFYTKFGVQNERYGTLRNTFTELFLFLVGRFDIADLMHKHPVIFPIVFTVFEILFFLLQNMFLAAIVYRWKDSRRDAQEFSLKSSFHKLYHAVAPRGKGGDEKQKHEMKLEKNFWQTYSILNYLRYLGANGKINITDTNRQNAAKRKALADQRANEQGDAPADNKESGALDVLDDEGDQGIDFSKEGADKFLAIFKKTHMEIASRLCRDVRNPDLGAGVGLDAEDHGNAAHGDEAAAYHDKDLTNPEMIGIIEEPVDDGIAEMISGKLDKLLQDEDHPAEEIWLDALVTVLEDVGALASLQKLFLSPPMLWPKGEQDWEKYSQMKIKMETRLNLFLQWLKEEMKMKHYNFLKDSATAKERVLKQQSLVLTDYLRHLEAQIQKLQEDIKKLERRNNAMRSHVSPLL
jgi:cell division protein FtsB